MRLQCRIILLCMMSSSFVLLYSIGILKAGHVCGDDLDLIDGLPTGSVRVSFGFSSTLEDAETFLSFVCDCFLRNKMRCFNEAKSSLIPENGRTDSRYYNIIVILMII